MEGARQDFLLSESETTSSVEVSSLQTMEMMLKLVCAGFPGMFKCDEGSCAYAYQGKSSHIVSNFSMSTVDTATTCVVIIGNYFDLVEDEDLVTVIIARCAPL